MTAWEQARLVRSKRASSLEIVRATLARIEALNPRVNAFITVASEQALAHARRADRAVARGKPLGALHGVPIAVKDNIETRGIRTTAGSRTMEDHVPAEDAFVVQRLKQAGAVIVGKTQLNEFARGPWAFGKVRNPWDFQRTPGGSSSGSGAAVGARMVAAAIGSDTGGSTRIPSALCGATGLKTTYGLVSRRGVIPLEWSMDNTGPIARTARDVALVLSAIAGHDPAGPSSVDRPAASHLRGLNGGVKGLRVGIPREYFFDVVDTEVKAAVLNAVKTLEGLGAVTDEVSMPMVRYTEEIGDAIVFTGALAALGDVMDRSPEKLQPAFLAQLRARRLVPAAVYVKAQRLRRVMRAEFLDALKKVDIIITPTTSMPAPLLDQSSFTVNGKPVRSFYALAGFTRPFSLAGLPALSAPCGFATGGLPIGMQIGGRPFDEGTVLRVAHAYQGATDWHRKAPVL